MSAENNNSNKKIDKLLIQLAFSPVKKIDYCLYYLNFLNNNYRPKQNINFKLKLKIKNINDKNFPGGKIKNISFRGEGIGTLIRSINKVYEIKKLNPNEETTIYLDKKCSPLKGMVWFNCDIKSIKEDQKIKTYQKNVKDELYDNSPNKWGDSFLIKGEMERNQKITNKLITLLTLLTLLEGIFGLSEIWNGFFNIISKLVSLIDQGL
ncbi:MAG: hypothetical protein K9K76_01260 [Halanaerobiales bacterium]|nr:hypothetical protein [Halanaerobiales bacterium]